MVIYTIRRFFFNYQILLFCSLFDIRNFNEVPDHVVLEGTVMLKQAMIVRKSIFFFFFFFSKKKKKMSLASLGTVSFST